jgi:hypothetical protein
MRRSTLTPPMTTSKSEPSRQSPRSLHRSRLSQSACRRCCVRFRRNREGLERRISLCGHPNAEPCVRPDLSPLFQRRDARRPQQLMRTSMRVAHLDKQGQDMVIVPLVASFGQKSSGDQPISHWFQNPRPLHSKVSGHWDRSVDVLKEFVGIDGLHLNSLAWSYSA